MENNKFLKKFIGRIELMGKGGIIGLMDSAHININKNIYKVNHTNKVQSSNLEEIVAKLTENQKFNSQINNFPENKKPKNIFNNKLIKCLKKKIKKSNSIANNNNDLFFQKSSEKINTNQICTLNNYLSKANFEIKPKRLYKKGELSKKNLKTLPLKDTELNQQKLFEMSKLKPLYYLPSIYTPSNNRQLTGISPILKSPFPILNYNQKYVDDIKRYNNINVNYNKSENNKLLTMKKVSKSLNYLKTKKFKTSKVKDFFEEDEKYIPKIKIKNKKVNYNISNNKNTNLYENKRLLRKVTSDFNQIESFDNLLNMINEEDDEDNKNKILIKKSRNKEDNNICYFSSNEDNEIAKLINQRKMFQKLLPKNSIFKINDELL